MRRAAIFVVRHAAQVAHGIVQRRHGRVDIVWVARVQPTLLGQVNQSICLGHVTLATLINL